MTMPLKIEEPICIAATGDVCGEGVLWERDTQSVYWTDINRFLVHRYALKDSALRTWFFSEPVTCVMETNRKDTLALSLGSGIALWQRGSDAAPAPLFALPGWPFVRCNDAAVDPGGALWVGSMRNNVKANGDAEPAGGTAGWFSPAAEPARPRNGDATWAFQIPCFGVRISPGSTSAIL